MVEQGATAGPARGDLRFRAVSSVGAQKEPWYEDFLDRSKEWKRLFAELFGTFFLVLTAAGGPTVAAYLHQPLGRSAVVVAPGLMVMAIILFMGTVSGAHLNPVVTLAFALRTEFPWRRTPGYLAAQSLGALMAALTLRVLLGNVGGLGGTYLIHGFGELQGAAIEALLTLGLVSTILGTASGAQNVGPLSAIAVGGYIALAGLWCSPLTGASMNPVRSFGPALVSGRLSGIAVYIVGPLIGSLLAVGGAWILRGKGGDGNAIRAAQGTL